MVTEQLITSLHSMNPQWQVPVSSRVFLTNRAPIRAAREAPREAPPRPSRRGRWKAPRTCSLALEGGSSRLENKQRNGDMVKLMKCWNMEWSSYSVPKDNEGAGALWKIKNQANLKIKWGQTPAFYFVGAFYFWGAQPIKLTDRNSMIAKMHRCERSDHSVKPSRDLESLGHYGAYETLTAVVVDPIWF